jgi:hypothetical protein
VATKSETDANCWYKARWQDSQVTTRVFSGINPIKIPEPRRTSRARSASLSMALCTPKKNVRNWYQYEASFSIELMVSFVSTLEKQANESIAHYTNTHSVTGHEGLDYETWDLDSIFGEYFPSLQRRSAFLTLWSFLEYQLDQLCMLSQAEKGFGLSFMDLSGKGIDRSTSYLEKVAELQGLKNSPQWNVLKTLQRIRNVIAHDDGKLQKHLGKGKDGIQADMKKLGFLSGDDEIVVAEGFLSKVVEACNDYFKLIEKAICTSPTA